MPVSSPRRRAADHGVDVRKIVGDLERDGAVAADEIVVVERVHQVSGHAVRTVILDRPPALVVRRFDDCGAQPLDGPQLGVGRGAHDEHAAGGACPLRGQSDPGQRSRRSPSRRLPRAIWGKPSHRVVGTADLERSNRLEGFDQVLDTGSSRQAHEQIAHGSSCLSAASRKSCRSKYVGYAAERLTAAFRTRQQIRYTSGNRVIGESGDLVIGSVD
jgi:hypothetical protein